MNIFSISADPAECAQALDDVRLNKMILETAQLLSGAYRHLQAQFSNEPVPDEVYKLTHANHPCSIWARDTMENYTWLYSYFNALNRERHHRTGKHHLSWVKLYAILGDYAIDEQEWDLPASWPDCSNIQNPNLDVFARYKQCLRNKWDADIEKNRSPKWTNRGEPSWRHNHETL